MGNGNVDDRSFNANVDNTTRQGNTWDGSPPDIPEPPEPTGIIVTPATADLAPAGTVQLEVAPEPPEAELGEVTASSSDEAVATVDAALLVTAVVDGVATVTVTDGTVSGVCEVTVATVGGE